MAASTTAPLRLTAPRFYEVTSADGTVLRAWTNDAEGPTVLLCNGLGTNPWFWPALLEPGCGVRVISWNHRGTGGSDRPADPSRIGVDAFVEDAVAVLDDAGVAACPAMGWSIGVNTMFELAVTHPDRVTAMFAVAGVPGDTFASMLAPLGVPRFVRKPLTVTTARIGRLLGVPLWAFTRRLPVGPVFVTWLTHSGFMLPQRDLALTRTAVREFLSTPVEWYMRLGLASSLHLRVSLRSIRVPTAFVAAKYDVLAGSADMASAAARIPEASYVELAASHFVPLERPDEVHEELLTLLDRVAAESVA